MNFIIKQKFMSLTDSYRVFDQDENLYMEVTQKALRLVGNLDFLKNNQIVYNAKQVAFKIPTRYELFKDDLLQATIQKKFTLFIKQFVIESPLGNFKVEGDFIDRKFFIYKDDMVAATITKRFLAWTDTYNIEINDKKNVDLIIAMAIIIDKVAHENRNNN